MDDEKKLVSSESENDENRWGSTFLLSLFLLLEAAAFASVTIWQERSLKTYTQHIETGSRLLAELEEVYMQHEISNDHSEYKVPQDLRRERRQSLGDLFRDLLNTQEQILMTVCQKHPDLCQFGPKGEIGDPGSAGPTGAAGLKGEPGPVGSVGDKGQPGPRGDTGSLGQPGPQGPKGGIGRRGPKGAKGVAGAKGTPGNPGPIGPDGKAGPPGDKGAPGRSGPKGDEGPLGDEGAKGEMGDSGPPGPRGEPGVAGPKGGLLDGDCLCVDVPTVSGNFSDVVSLHLHQPTTLHCDASDPKATISWQRNDGKPFTANVQSAGNDLIFTSVTAAEQGVYKCVASSTFGNVHKDVEIKLVAPSPYDCDFEQDLCSWTDSQDDRFDWTRLSGPTPSAGTGPTADHTLGTAQGYYAYIESSGARVNGDNARLESLTMNPSQSYCLTFWYHLYGNSIGNINVRINKNGVTGNALWTVNGPNEDVWKHAVIDIAPQTTPFHLVIEGVRGNSYNGDAAIDDIVVLESPCP